MKFDYEKSVWGTGSASSAWGAPTFFRLRQAQKILSPAAAVLEVGCGAGQFIRALKQRQNDLLAHGCDISVSAIARARQFQDGVTYAVSSETLPYADASFDAVIIFDVLEHVAGPDRLLREIFRVLKPGGKFYCFVPCEGDPLSFWFYLRRLNNFKDLTEKYAGHVNHWSRQQWLELIVRERFVVDNKVYSEHLVGQILGVLSFWLMSRQSRGEQINNEQYFVDLNSRHRGGFFRLFKYLVNVVINLESVIFSRIPSPNLHLFLRKPST